METVNQATKESTAAEQKTPERTFTQAEVDAIVGERLSRDRAKYANYDELKAKAEQFDVAEELRKTELQKAVEKAQKLQAELDGMKKAASVKEMREKVSADTGVPANLLSAEDEAGCKAQAEAILAFAKPQGYPVVKDDRGEPRRTSGGATRDHFKDWFDQSLTH